MISLNNYKIRVIFVTGAILIYSVLFFLFPAVMIDGIRKGLSVCGSVIIPSLFPFTVISDFVLRSGLGSIIGKKLYPLTNDLFHLPV